MAYLFGLAFKNLTRYKRRTIITAGAIAFGLAMYIYMDSMMQGIIKDSETNLFKYETGSAQIYAPEYYGERNQLSTKHLIEEPSILVDSLNEAGIVGASPRLTVSAELINEENGIGQRVVLTGIDPELDEKVFSFAPTVKEANEVLRDNHRKALKENPEAVEPSLGRYLESGDEGIVLGGWLAEELEVVPGDFITVNFNMRPLYDEAKGEWLSGSFSSEEMEVIGLVKTGNPIVNRGHALMVRGFLDYLIEADGGATSVVIRVPQGRRGSKLLSAAEEVVADHFGVGSVAAVRNQDLLVHWRELVASFLAVAAADEGGTVMILFLIALIAAIGISNTMMMSVMERKREIGMLRSLGMTRGQLLTLFVIEAGGIGLIGAFGGILLGVLLNIWLIYFGIDFGWMMRDFDVGYRIADVMRGVWNFPTIFGGAIFTVLITALFALLPANRALKQPIPETLRVE